MKIHLTLFKAVGFVALMGSLGCAEAHFSAGSDSTGAGTANTSALPTQAPPLAPVVEDPPGEVIDPSQVADFTCQRMIELSAESVLTIAPRSGDGLCYVVKLISASHYAPSDTKPAPDSDLVSRNHDGAHYTSFDVHHPYLLGQRALNFILSGPRQVKLSGAPDTTTPITVDNFILVGVSPHDQLGNPSYYKAYGTSDSTIFDSDRIQFKQQGVALQSFATGGTSTIAPLGVEGRIGLNQNFSLDVRALDCGATGVNSDIYLVFQ